MHTTGPWKVKEQGIADDYVLLTNSDKWVIAIRQNGEIMPPEQAANARLIAAAPELLEALKELCELVDDIYNHVYKPDSFTTQPGRLAIAKAETV